MPLVYGTQVASSVPFDNSTNGFVATDVEVAIEETKNYNVALEAESSSNDTTTSGTDALLVGMTLTPPIAGTYMVWFSTTITSNNAGSAITVSMYIGGTQKADSVRKIAPFDGGALSATTARGDVSINGIVTVNGSQAITIEWSTSGGTATCGPRTLNTMRLT